MPLSFRQIQPAGAFSALPSVVLRLHHLVFVFRCVTDIAVGPPSLVFLSLQYLSHLSSHHITVGLCLAGWASSRGLDFVSRVGFCLAGWILSRGLDFFSWVGLFLARLLDTYRGIWRPLCCPRAGGPPGLVLQGPLSWFPLISHCQWCAAETSSGGGIFASSPLNSKLIMCVSRQIET
jgi:hypothetical protein